MAKSKSKMKINENSKPTSINEEKRPKEIKGNIVVDFSNPFSLYSCAVKGIFTNYLKSRDNAFDNHQRIFTEALSYFSENNFDDMRNSKGTHTHEIKGNDKIELIKKILKELIICQNGNYKNADTIIKNLVADADLWQLGYPNGMRFIGARKGNIINLFFLDYHHLIYPNKNYNNKDFYTYKYCLMRNSKNELLELETASEIEALKIKEVITDTISTKNNI
ncbi:hypothetical protein G9F72_019335 [Clostridium estertheticum]|uniref:hypothetical protein n=1 Tax=Clostridium estertheticum TaxID=238834 RepID=UPI0013E985BD|nr:hypothetical protein [Clostridium estertheticum]MBZ9688486.1 hypothetical protein [Clostridium estertheticum]